MGNSLSNNFNSKEFKQMVIQGQNLEIKRLRKQLTISQVIILFEALVLLIIALS